MDDPHCSLATRMLETVSLALCYETQDPRNPITRAALRHSLQDLVAELQAMDNELSQDRPTSKGTTDTPSQ